MNTIPQIIKGWANYLTSNLFTGCHPITSGLFRIVAGSLLFIQFFRMEEYITQILPQSDYQLTYDFFHWVKIMPPYYLKLLFLILKIAATLFTLGVLYRISSIILFLGWTYVFLLDSGHYNNHYYLYSLIIFLMMFMRADSWGSLAHWLGKRKLNLFLHGTFGSYNFRSSSCISMEALRRLIVTGSMVIP